MPLLWDKGDNALELWNKLIENSADKDCNAFLFTSPVNRRYVTGFPSSAGIVAVTPEKVTFITDFRYYESALQAQKDGTVPEYVDIKLWENGVYDKLALEIGTGKTALVEENYVTGASFEWLKSVFAKLNIKYGASAPAGALRAVKTEAEVEKIKKAQSITDMAFEYIVGYISDNLDGKLTESRVAIELEYYMKLHGASGLAFDTIAVNGKKSAMPHGVPADIPLGNGFLTMDFGAAYDGYCSDMTRTVCIGKPTEKMKDVYDTVLAAQLLSLEGISAGKTGKEIDRIARDYIAKRGYDGTFGHSLGHSLGLEIHESPNFSSGESRAIPSGAVLSVEPGIYIEGEFGVRIEDIVNITQTGCKNLTHSPKELIIL